MHTLANANVQVNQLKFKLSCTPLKSLLNEMKEYYDNNDIILLYLFIHIPIFAMMGWKSTGLLEKLFIANHETLL